MLTTRICLAAPTGILFFEAHNVERGADYIGKSTTFHTISCFIFMSISHHKAEPRKIDFIIPWTPIPGIRHENNNNFLHYMYIFSLKWFETNSMKKIIVQSWPWNAIIKFHSENVILYRESILHFKYIKTAENSPELHMIDDSALLFIIRTVSC